MLAVFSGCASESPGDPSNESSKSADEITISAAISLKDAFSAIGNAFTAANGIKVRFNFASSGALERQIENGAPVDVFASAGEDQMDRILKKGFIDPASKSDFAQNSIVLITPADRSLKISSFEDLRRDDVLRIAIGNPKTVPAGQYAEETLNNLKLSEPIKKKLILTENVRQVLDYVVRGEVDAGIVYSTDARAAGENIKVPAIASESDHSPIVYPIAVVKETKTGTAARAFVDFVLSEKGQKILQEFGFRSAQKK
ncbi:MAG: molybdate ABC transporter substrate-binding protein [Pyrinomonadaceae bacterium]